MKSLLKTAGGMICDTDSFTTGFLSATYPGLASQISPIVYYLLLMYWGWQVIGYWQGHIAVSFKDIAVKAAFSVLIFWALNWGSGASWVYGTTMGSMMK
jgi:hypothetical protein